jgi:2-C-methyl-D-erythritol 4-phosphate cytidylyltransferase
MADDPQQVQQKLVEQALADPQVAEAVRAYDAVRPFVPQQTFAAVVTSYSSSTSITPSDSPEA